MNRLENSKLWCVTLGHEYELRSYPEDNCKLVDQSVRNKEMLKGTYSETILQVSLSRH